MPVVPLLALPLVKNAPPTVAVPLMLNVAGEAELVTTEGLAAVAVTNVAATRVALLYATTSVQPAWEDIVSAAAGVFEAPAPYKPMYQEVIWVTEVKALPAIY